MGKKFRAETDVSIIAYNGTPNKVLQKKIIMEFFRQMDLDTLKSIVNIEEIHFNDPKLRYDKNYADILEMLFHKRAVRFVCEISIDEKEHTMGIRD